MLFFNLREEGTVPSRLYVMHGSLKSFTNREIFDLGVVAYALNRGLVVPELLRIKRRPQGCWSPEGLEMRMVETQWECAA